MKRRKGFTVIELLICVVLLAIVGGVIIYNMTNISKTNKDTEYERYVATIKSAANVYADLNPDAINALYSDKSYVIITIDDLIKAGLLEGDATNPYTGKPAASEEEVIVYLDPEKGSLDFIYPINAGSSDNQDEISESSKDHPLDNDGDGMPDHYKPIDENKDGKIDGWDTDGDNKVDAFDTNGDGIPDVFDRNGDGLYDAFDTTGNGIADTFDDDYDGLPDHYKPIDENKDGKVDGWDTNGDGKIDAFDKDGNGLPEAFDYNHDGKIDSHDTNGDGLPDEFDINNDGDIDSYDTNHDGIPDSFDTNNDKKIDAFDTDKNGKADSFDTDGDGKTDAFDTNGDGKVDTFDKNGDGVVDAWDTNGDGTADSYDKNKDGIPDHYKTIDENNDGKIDGFDTNNDGKIDAFDKDGDGKVDAWDTNGDGKIDRIDTNGDGIPDQFDNNHDGILDHYKPVDKNKDGKIDGWDTNGDGIVDAFDKDGNGIPDSFDKDGDGKVDSYDTDNDGIVDKFDNEGGSGNTDEEETKPGSGSHILEGIRQKEVFLVSMADYVVYGEDYNCMQGAGSYELALSDEDGNLIMLNDKANIDKYSFKCSMPSNFNPKNAQAYRVNYSWMTESGKVRNATRTLRVLPKVNPTVKFNNQYVEGQWFTPTYNSSNKTWNYLTFTPTIEGADNATSSIRISKQSKEPAGKIEKVTVNPTNNDFIKEFKTYPADDGNKIYYLDTIVYGHHDKDYSYIASGSVNIKQHLVIPTSFVTGVGTNWSTNKTFTIGQTYSPVGIEKYEYKISDSNTDISDSTYVEEMNTINKTNAATSKNINILNNSCKRQKNQYRYLFVRAINEDGFVGKWSEPINIYLTNQLDLVLGGESKNCTNSNNCCKDVGNGACKYTAKTRYIDFAGLKMIALQKTNSNRVLAAYEGVSGNKVTPTSVQYGTVAIKTCDGTYTYGYNYSSAVTSRITNEANNFLRKMPSSYPDIIEYRSWNGYSSYIGVPTSNDLNMYSSALSDKNVHWTTTSFSNSFRINARWGYYAIRYNTYFYAINGSSLTGAYAGSSAYVKPLVSFKTNYICSGDGTSKSPYVIAY